MGLTDDRNEPCLRETRPDGQQECYLVLSDEERAKGFVRPVRRSYRHVGPSGPVLIFRFWLPDGRALDDVCLVVEESELRDLGKVVEKAIASAIRTAKRR